MKHIFYSGPHEAVDLPDGTRIERGKPTEVSEALADSLCIRRDFKLVEPHKKEKAK